MARFNLVGPSYQSQSVNASAQVTRNWYVENIEDEGGKSKRTLYPTPGLASFSALPDAPGRGILFFKGRCFCVAGSTLFELFSDSEFATLGTVANDGLPASLVANGPQLAIAAGQKLYVVTLATNAFQQVTTLNGPVSQLGYGDGFGIALLSNSGSFQISSPLDFTTWPGLQQEAVSVFPDNITTMLVDHREIIVGGPKASIGYYDSGSTNVYDVIPGGYMEIGAAALWGRAKADNTVFWWSANDDGGPIARQATGYQPTRISNHAIEYEIQNYPTWTDVICYTFQEFGHTFWHSYFPSANGGLGKSWRYDLATNLWHEVSYWDVQNGRDIAHKSAFHSYAFNKHLVMDPTSGTVFQMSSSFSTDAGNPIRRVRRSPHLSEEEQWMFGHELQIDIESGVGPQPPLTGGIRSSFPQQVFVLGTDNNPYVVNAGDNGLYVYGLGTPGSLASNIIISDSQVANTAWQLVVVLNQFNQPDLALTEVPFTSNLSKSFNMTTQGGNVLTATALNGLIQTTVTTGSPLPRGPQLMIRKSLDGGHTYSQPRQVDFGQAGEFRKRAILRRLGKWRSCIWEISCTDPVPVRIIDAYLKANSGTAEYKPTERLVRQIQKGA